MGTATPPDDCPPPAFTLHDRPSSQPGEPIRVARKIRGRKCPNVFLDDRGFPDQSHEFDVVLHNINGGPILRCRKHPAPNLDDVDPKFASTYDEATHGKRLCTDLNLSHLEPLICDAVYALIQKYWSVFDDKGLFITVKDYKCSIDTGSARPICAKEDQLLTMRDPHNAKMHLIP